MPTKTYEDLMLKKYMNKLLGPLGPKCLICNEGRSTEKAHIIPRWLTKHIKVPESRVFVLCHNHHWCYDNGSLYGHELDYIKEDFLSTVGKYLGFIEKYCREVTKTKTKARGERIGFFKLVHFWEEEINKRFSYEVECLKDIKKDATTEEYKMFVAESQNLINELR